MIDAAQAAAEAALAEAVAREQQGSQEHHQQQLSEQQLLAALLQQQQQQQHEQEFQRGQMDPFQQAAMAAGISNEHQAAKQMLQSLGYQIEDEQSLLTLMAQQEKLAQLRKRPKEHFLSVAKDGTILEATETVTGFPPEVLLMTSWYDAVYDEDLPGFLAVKTNFWDNSEPGVDLYLRRRTLEGDWIWLRCKVIQYIEQPVNGTIVKGYIAHEQVVEDEDVAIRINRMTRIAAILVQAVEAARASSPKPPVPKTADIIGSFGKQEIPHVADDAAMFQSWLRQAQQHEAATAERDTNSSVLSPSLSGPLHSMMKDASTGGAAENRGEEVEKEGFPAGGDDAIRQLQSELMHNTGEDKKSFDPMSTLKSVRAGIRLDLGMIRLTREEVKLVTLVLTGRIAIREVGTLIYKALNSPGQNLSKALAAFLTDSEQQHFASSTSHLVPLEPMGRQGSRGRNRGRHPSPRNSRTGSAPSLHNSPSSFHQIWRSAPNIKSPNPAWKSAAKQNSEFPPRPHSPIPPEPPKLLSPAAISVVNMSYTYMGNAGIEMLSEILYVDNSEIQTLDISFCGIDEKGMLAFARALTKRYGKGLKPLKGLVLSGNYISYKAAKYLGTALSCPSEQQGPARKRAKVNKGGSTGYEEDDESDDDDCEEEGFAVFLSSSRASKGKKRFSSGSSISAKSCRKECCAKGQGLRVLHVGATSLTGEALIQLLQNLGPHCPIEELSVPSNKIGPDGAGLLVKFMEGRGGALSHPVMPFLDRLDLTNTDLGNEGTARLTGAISRRKAHFVDLRLSCNEIGVSGIETLMNKLLQHNIVSLSLDKNNIGDQGCQLVAASLQSMHQLSRLNLSFNQIGSRGISSLMKKLIGCDSITYLGLSGNIMKISGAIAMGFTLAQHPRIEELDLDNCCLSQAAQCHIVAGIISNRWVPMKILNGFQAGPPMVAIGALDVFAHNLSNEECFQRRRDEQMKTILQWMESNRAALRNGRDGMPILDGLSQQQYLTPEFVSTVNDVQGSPSQNAYLRMLGWLSKIPFDEDELTSLRKYFYDTDGGDDDRGSDGYINLKVRGDLLAALDSCLVAEIGDTIPGLDLNYKGSVGFELDEYGRWDRRSSWKTLRSSFKDKMASTIDLMSSEHGENMECEGERDSKAEENSDKFESMDIGSKSSIDDPIQNNGAHSLKRSQKSFGSQPSVQSSCSDRKSKVKARISMFPQFEEKLEQLKIAAKEMMDQEEDPEQQELILTHYAEASLTILRQLRYRCMNTGLDGWRQGGLKRKVLIVDDSLVTRKLVARAFEKADFIVDTAENGVEGVKKLQQSIYDIAFMDIDMPVMNGFEATKALRQWEDKQRPGARQPICALTAAYVDDFERSELMKFKEAGLDVMESKPCNIPRLFKVVDDVSPMFSDLSISVSQSGSSAMMTST